MPLYSKILFYMLFQNIVHDIPQGLKVAFSCTLLEVRLIQFYLWNSKKDFIRFTILQNNNIKMRLDWQNIIPHLLDPDHVLYVVAVVGQCSLLLLAQSLTALAETRTRGCQHSHVSFTAENQNQKVATCTSLSSMSTTCCAKTNLLCPNEQRFWSCWVKAALWRLFNAGVSYAQLLYRLLFHCRHLDYWECRIKSHPHKGWGNPVFNNSGGSNIVQL